MPAENIVNRAVCSRFGIYFITDCGTDGVPSITSVKMGDRYKKYKIHRYILYVAPDSVEDRFLESMRGHSLIISKQIRERRGNELSTAGTIQSNRLSWTPNTWGGLPNLDEVVITRDDSGHYLVTRRDPAHTDDRSPIYDW